MRTLAGREAAPGPGRSAIGSTVLSKVGGMQKTLTALTSCVPGVRHASGDTPVALIVFADPAPKAPGLRCRQLRHALVPAGPQPVVYDEHSESTVHGSPTQLPPASEPPQSRMPWQALPAFGPPAQWPTKL